MIIWPGLRRSVSAISRLFNSAAFDAPLTHSAIPTRAASGTTATFTRATTATVRDNEGVLRTAIAGEARFEGARMVRNLFTFTEDIGNAAWTKRETTYSGGRLIETAATADHSVWEAASTTAGNYYVASGHAKADQNSVIQITFSSGQVSGDPKANFNLSTGALGTVDAGLTAEIEAAPDIGQGYYRVSVKAQAASTSLTAFFAMVPLPTSVRLANYAGNISNGLYLNKMQLEDVTAQTTQTAGEYVSVGVASSPYYHGSMVDGVKCFPTDISGNPIPSTTLLGYLAEGARTNLCLQSQNLGTTWIPANTTVVIDSAVAPDGTTTADKFYPTTTGANRYIYQPITETIASYTKSFYAKSAGMSWVVPLTFTGAALGVWFDVTNGVVGTVTGGYTATIKSVGNGWYRCAVTGTAPISAIFGIGISDADNSTTATTSGTNGIYLWGMQSELGSFASSYIPTTTVAVARNADVLTYSSAGNVSGTVGWCYAEATPYANNADTNNYYIADSAGASVPLYSNGVDGNAVIYDQTNAAIKGGTTFVNTPFKCASTWGGSSISVTSRGQSPASAAFDGDMGPFTSLYIGATSGGSSLWGSIKNVRIGQRQLSSSELGAITS